MKLIIFMPVLVILGLGYNNSNKRKLKNNSNIPSLPNDKIDLSIILSSSEEGD